MGKKPLKKKLKEGLVEGAAVAAGEEIIEATGEFIKKITETPEPPVITEIDCDSHVSGTKKVTGQSRELWFWWKISKKEKKQWLAILTEEARQNAFEKIKQALAEEIQKVLHPCKSPCKPFFDQEFHEPQNFRTVENPGYLYTGLKVVCEISADYSYGCTK